ncbi:chemotaxis protein histidine kinase CheA [Psychromicrobium silvestre]|uniref:Chemotaxis protein histidine kinase CheA n=1 Tax=Psychromicrobium silvestre TaxID=1645614 RepID=A0A7Y9LRY5_9MICC|nr:hypothetical protein [Psychromicrobium silvestre]NYE94496.1 chemotaxis protein histidine kinase CheA [Psychromicrobium silvestre]
MSQDAEQPRSRRELRRTQGSATSAASAEAPASYPTVPLLPPSAPASDAPVPSAPVTNPSVASAPVHTAPVGSAASARERKGHANPAQLTRQAIRAEERARLAALAEQSQQAEVPESVEQPTAGTPAVAEAPAGTAEPTATEQPLADPAALADSAEAPSAAAGSSRRALEAPVDAPVQRQERRSQVRARDRAALRAYREVAEAAPPAEPLPSRRLLRQQMLEAEKAPVTAANQVVPAPAGRQALSVPQALAERDALAQDAQAKEELIAQAQEHADALPTAEDPLKVDVEVLAQQKALAERAAILNERAQTRAKLAEESAGTRQKLNDPTMAHNLAMVTPLQFVKMPGVERPVLKPPSTSHVPVVTRSTPAVLPKPVRPPSTPPKGNTVADGTPAMGTPGQVLRRAEQMARVRPRFTAQGDEQETAPLPANSAHGLEPLDAVTAGLGRVRRSRLWQWGVGLVGGGALLAGLIMIISSMAR